MQPLDERLKPRILTDAVESRPDVRPSDSRLMTVERLRQSREAAIAFAESEPDDSRAAKPSPSTIEGLGDMHGFHAIAELNVGQGGDVGLGVPWSIELRKRLLRLM
jgi:hypothetical protein